MSLVLTRKPRMVKNKGDSSEMIFDRNKLRVSEYAYAAAWGVLEIIRLKRRLPEKLRSKLKYNENEVAFASKFILEDNYKYMGASISEYYDLLKSQVKDPIALYILWLAYMKAINENSLSDFDQKAYGKIARSINDFTNYLHDLTGVAKAFFTTPFRSRINKAISESDNTFWI